MILDKFFLNKKLASKSPALLELRHCISWFKDAKRYHKSFLTASKGVLTIAYTMFKANTSLYPNFSRYSGAIKVCEKFVSPDKEKKFNITNRLSNSLFA